MYLAIGIEVPGCTTNGASRRGWLIHEVLENQLTEYRGFYDADGSTNTVRLRQDIPDVYEMCNRIPVTPAYFRECKAEPFRMVSHCGIAVEHEAHDYRHPQGRFSCPGGPAEPGRMSPGLCAFKGCTRERGHAGRHGVRAVA